MPMVVTDGEEEDVERATVITTCGNADCQALLQKKSARDQCGQNDAQLQQNYYIA